MAWTRSTLFEGSSSSMSRVPGAPPRTSTPATTPAAPVRMTVQPVGRSVSVWWPTVRPATAVRPFAASPPDGAIAATAIVEAAASASAGASLPNMAQTLAWALDDPPHAADHFLPRPDRRGRGDRPARAQHQRLLRRRPPARPGDALLDHGRRQHRGGIDGRRGRLRLPRRAVGLVVGGLGGDGIDRARLVGRAADPPARRGARPADARRLPRVALRLARARRRHLAALGGHPH